MESDRKVLDTLRGMRFFQGVAEDDLNKLVPFAKLEEYGAGETIFREGEQASKFFLVVEGSVGLEIVSRDGAAKRIFTVDPGELLGWSPILKSGVMKATARTLTRTNMIAFDAAQTLSLFERTPKLAALLLRQVARALAERLHATRLHMLEVCHHQLPDVVPLGSHEGAD